MSGTTIEQQSSPDEETKLEPTETRDESIEDKPNSRKRKHEEDALEDPVYENYRLRELCRNFSKILQSFRKDCIQLENVVSELDEIQKKDLFE